MEPSRSQPRSSSPGLGTGTTYVSPTFSRPTASTNTIPHSTSSTAPPSPTTRPPHSPVNPPPAATSTSSTCPNLPPHLQPSNPSHPAAPTAPQSRSPKAALSPPPRSRTPSPASPTLPAQSERQTTACPPAWTTWPTSSSKLPFTGCPATSRHPHQSALQSARAAQTAARQSRFRRCRIAPAARAHATATALRAQARKSSWTAVASDAALMTPALAAQSRRASQRVNPSLRMRPHATRRRRSSQGALPSAVDAGDRWLSVPCGWMMAFLYVKYIHCFLTFPFIWAGRRWDHSSLLEGVYAHFIVSLAAPCDDISSGDAAPMGMVGVDGMASEDLGSTALHVFF